jgi:hypothetical protein
MIVDGPTTTRDDGSTVCIGYGEDVNGRVTGRFALPQGHDWDAPDATESMTYVGSMAELPDVDDEYLVE